MASYTSYSQLTTELLRAEAKATYKYKNITVTTVAAFSEAKTQFDYYLLFL